MKKLFFILTGIAALTISCSRVSSNPDSDDLLATMLAEKSIAAEYLKYYDVCSAGGTKAGLPEEERVIVPEWAYDYVLQYLEPDNLESWDEVAICNSLAEDFNLSSDEKQYVAVLIGDLSVVKDAAIASIDEAVAEMEAVMIEEKTPFEPEGKKMPEEDCYSRYVDQVKWALIENLGVGICGGGAVGGLPGVGLGIIGGLIHSIGQIRQYGREYVRCTA